MAARLDAVPKLQPAYHGLFGPPQNYWFGVCYVDPDVIRLNGDETQDCLTFQV